MLGIAFYEAHLLVLSVALINVLCSTVLVAKRSATLKFSVSKRDLGSAEIDTYELSWSTQKRDESLMIGLLISDSLISRNETAIYEAT
jgi:hypothetical protein